MFSLGQVTCGNPSVFSSEARIWMGLGLGKEIYNKLLHILF